jgi:AraC-like DNA-binding protein
MPNGPAYIPQDYCKIPRLFGVNPSVGFDKPETAEDDDVALRKAAEIQHRFACLVRSRLIDKGVTIKRLAEHAGMDRTRLGRLLNGQVVMRLADIGRISTALRLDLPEWSPPR